MASSYPKTVEDRAKLYLHCMVEIKERLSLIRGILPADIPDLFKNEICSLQFRHICELIAIACLAAQGDFKTQRAFREAYSPADIFNALRTIFPRFFPQCTTVTFTPGKDGRRDHHHLKANSKPDAYKDADIVKLWGRSGNDLHRASVKKYLKATFGSPPSLDTILRHLRGLIRLLETHVVPIGSPDSKLLLDVRLSDDDDMVVANFMELDPADGTASVRTWRAQVTER